MHPMLNTVFVGILGDSPEQALELHHVLLLVCDQGLGHDVDCYLIEFCKLV